MKTKAVNARWWLWLLVSLFSVAIDQLTKWLIVRKMTEGQSVVLTPFLNFTFVYNHGAAFSFLNGAGGWQVPVLFFVATAITGGLVYWLRVTPRTLRGQSLALSLIIGGAVGNIIDRVRLHKVVDFIDFHVNHWHFAIFNVADMAVSIGVIVLILLTIFIKEYR